MAITKPQVLISQQLTPSPTSLEQQLSACIVGPLAKLHRFSVADEKININVGAYDRNVDTAYPWPGRTAGSVVDFDSVKLFVSDALLLYFEDLLNDNSGGRGSVAAVSGKNNRVRSSAVNFKTNGDYLRSALLFDRDVQIGDRVYIRGVADSDADCTEVELWSYVTGFAAEPGTAVVHDAEEGTSNQATTFAETEIEKIAGPTNCVTATADGTDYDGLADGNPTETYTIEVVASSVAGCNAARLRVTSASGNDNAEDVVPEDFGTPTAIGSRGLTVTFDTDAGNCSLSAESEGVSTDELVVGQKWRVTVTQDFEAVCAISGGTYTGPTDDTYIVEVTKGGTWASQPTISVTTVKGLDFSGPTTVSGPNTAIPIGSYGVTIEFVDCFGSDPVSADSEGESFGGDDTVAALCTGDKFYVQVESGVDGPIKTLILKHDIPASIRSNEDLDLRLFMVRDIQVSETRLNSPPDKNYENEATQMVVNAGMTAYDSAWTDDGVAQPLTVFGGTLYIEYREWLAATPSSLQFAITTDDLDDIPGQLDVLNPLKWGVFRAMQNANGSTIGYIIVGDPTDLDNWSSAIGKLAGRDEVYNIVPMSNDADVYNLVETYVNTESTEVNNNWKAAVFGMTIDETQMIVGESSAADQEVRPTSADGGVVLATLTDNPDASGTQYTRLSVPASNGNFITYGVQAGDIVRYLFTIDAFGETTYTEFVVDSVLSEDSLLLLSGHTVGIAVAQKVEIWRALSKDEITTNLVDTATGYANRRVVAVLPDIAYTGGVAQAGYYVAAAFAGLASGVLAHQPLTNAAISGFDDLASRTRDYFTESQLSRLESAGILICTEDRTGTPIIRHALTTDVSSLAAREENMRRNLDAISYVFLRTLQPYIGRTNATPALLDRLKYVVEQTIKTMKTQVVSNDLGPQLVDGVIASDANGQPLFGFDPLAADKLVVVLNLTLPAPLNNIQLTLVV